MYLKSYSDDQTARKNLYIEQNQLIYKVTILWLKGGVSLKKWAEAKVAFIMNAIQISP